ncbi:hypothetical protein [Williamsia sp. D3]|uniref:hypothetical protein n=1 Tax=Williamsia sp. D3 TaxID=1313067 RepID=UPI0003D31E07|nr:hypothetical protein [Williamsia sp. D3]ETD34662.1 hypothetical protein W823_02210 [Williamsia sp. D3]
MKKFWLGAAAAVTITVLVLLSTQQTGATWRDQDQIGDAALTSGELKILAGGSNTYPWTAFGGTNLSPGSVVQRPLTITVVGNTKVSYRLLSISPTTSGIPLTFSASVVNSTAGCPASGNPTGIVAGPWTAFPSAARTVPINTSEVWCLQATVGNTAPQNSTSSVTLNFRADQQL